VEALTASSLNALRKFDQIRGIVEKTKPQLVIATYEGYAWERMAFNGARSAKPDIKCVGYTHAPLFERQHAAWRPLGERFNPNQIMTSGSIQKEQLECTKALNNTPIEVLGSKRINTLQKADAIEFRDTQKKQQEQKTCLVIPEGIESEIKILFEFSLQCAMEFADLHFIWRLHPLFSFETLARTDHLYRSLPDNIELSSQRLEADFERCQWALYRGSSAIIQAVMAGLKPVYLHQQREMKFDPLYELKSWKDEVESPHDFNRVMSTEIEFKDHCQAALEYCRKTYEPFNHRPLIKLLDKTVSHA